MDFLIEAMLNDCSSIVEDMLDSGLSVDEHFTVKRMVQLYSRVQEFDSCYKYLEAAYEKNRQPGDDEIRFLPSDVRTALKDILKGSYPLLCIKNDNDCITCSERLKEDELSQHKTCLNPIQEMFLWALLTNEQKLAKLFWKKSEDKMASALVAKNLLSALAKKEENAHRAFKLKQDAQEFQDMAVSVLKICHEIDEEPTQLLLTRKTSWWAGKSIIELAVKFQNRVFIAQPACKVLLDRIWNGRIKSEPPTLFMLRQFGGLVPFASNIFFSFSENRPQEFSTSDDDCDQKTTCWENTKSFYTAPIMKYLLHVVSFIAFMFLFSYVLLIDLQPGFTISQGILCGWVFLHFMEEVRQMADQEEQKFSTKVKMYFKQNWNKVDAVTILLFLLGMVLSPIHHEIAYWFRRGLLSMDFIFFSIRLLQVFAVGKEIGPMLTMIGKMIKDTKTFSIILMVVVLSYAVASEAILFPQTKANPDLFYYVPRKAYWQVYGDFFLGEIEGTEGECTNQVSLYSNRTIPRCPSDVGRYLVPILLGGYSIITHILLVNLLIAKFNDTFTKVHSKAIAHWSWHRCQTIREYYYRPCLPPPLNFISFLINCVCKIFYCLKRLCCRCCSSFPSRSSRNETNTSTMLLRPGPQNLHIMKRDIGSVEIAWDPPKQGNVTKYEIQYQLKSQRNSRFFSPEGLETVEIPAAMVTSYYIKDLYQGKTYIVYVRAEFDQMEWSEHSQVEVKVKCDECLDAFEKKCMESHLACEDYSDQAMSKLSKYIDTCLGKIESKTEDRFNRIKENQEAMKNVLDGIAASVKELVKQKDQ